MIINIEKNLNYIKQLSDGVKRFDSVKPFDSAFHMSMWMEDNCLKCQKCFTAHHPDHELPQFEESKELVRKGQECIGKLAMDMMINQPTIPDDIAKMIGYEKQLPTQCAAFKKLEEAKEQTENPNQMTLFN
ncbi:hypothetical protein V6R21_19835 [Limibacter armeniacum]|uniref:hypothetical protein n=1 Tax=Limibacter armeniacum TaxID=466084 RepID=UPI002FE663BA